MIIIYQLPSIIGAIFQIILLILFWLSKKDYFWLAFVFVISSSPGALFSMQDEVHSFSLLYGSSFGNVYFYLPFILIAFLKTVKVKIKYPKYFFSGILLILFFYFVLLLAAHGIYKWTAVVRLTIPWLLLFILPRMLKNEVDYSKFFNLIFPFVFFVIITQIYKIITAQEFAALFGGIGNPAVVASKDLLEGSSVIRPTDGIIIPFISLLGAFYFLSKRTKIYYNKNYLTIIAGLSVFSIFLTATRSWFFSALFILFSFLVLNSMKPVKNLLKYTFATILIIILIQAVPYLQKQSVLAFERYETIGYLLEGDITAGGTLQRLDVRAPKVMARFYEKPVFGWGYGIEGASYSDGHVGHQNLLMHTGIVGYSLFFAFWLLFIFKLLNVNKKISYKNDYYKIPIGLILFFLGIHIINISAQWFNFLISFTNGFILCLLLSLANLVYWESLKEEKIISAGLKNNR